MRFEITSKKWLGRWRNALSAARDLTLARAARTRVAHTPTISQSLRSACLAGFVALATVSCNAAPKSPPGSGIVVDKDKKPMAGVHVIVWRDYVPARSWWDLGNGVDAKSRPWRCHKEHYALTDAQGRFTFPGEVIDRPGEPFNSYLGVAAIREGMVAKSYSANIEPSSTGLGKADGFRMDYFPTSEKPLALEVLMEPFYTSLEDMTYLKQMPITTMLSELVRSGCSCSEFRKAVWAEEVKVHTAWRKTQYPSPLQQAALKPIDKTVPGCEK
jgi:hypothetical protein